LKFSACAETVVAKASVAAAKIVEIRMVVPVRLGVAFQCRYDRDMTLPLQARDIFTKFAEIQPRRLPACASRRLFE
jgi:hypothetical protein